jgi:hypothetical protein
MIDIWQCEASGTALVRLAVRIVRYPACSRMEALVACRFRSRDTSNMVLCIESP